MDNSIHGKEDLHACIADNARLCDMQMAGQGGVYDRVRLLAVHRPVRGREGFHLGIHITARRIVRYTFIGYSFKSARCLHLDISEMIARSQQTGFSVITARSHSKEISQATAHSRGIGFSISSARSSNIGISVFITRSDIIVPSSNTALSDDSDFSSSFEHSHVNGIFCHAVRSLHFDTSSVTARFRNTGFSILSTRYFRIGFSKSKARYIHV